jgi:hypothetical protein
VFLVENQQKITVFDKKSMIFKSLIGIGFTILCITFAGKYAYVAIMGVRLIGLAFTKQG